jgi:hypothetical protein
MNDSPLRLLGVHRSFGEVTVFSDLSLDISRGEFLAVVGPSFIPSEIKEAKIDVSEPVQAPQ